MALAGYRLDAVHVMVADDNAHMRELLVTILDALGVGRVHTASDGGAAIRKMREHPCDILIADWNMEPMDGVELVRRVRRGEGDIDPYLPVIMLTGHTERARVTMARDAGVTEFMAKPVSARSLYARIVSVIEHPRPFIRTKDYFGPDRRRQSLPFQGPDRRQAPRTGDDPGESPVTKETVPADAEGEAATKRSRRGHGNDR